MYHDILLRIFLTGFPSLQGKYRQRMQSSGSYNYLILSTNQQTIVNPSANTSFCVALHYTSFNYLRESLDEDIFLHELECIKHNSLSEELLYWLLHILLQWRYCLRLGPEPNVFGFYSGTIPFL